MGGIGKYIEPNDKRFLKPIWLSRLTELCVSKFQTAKKHPKHVENFHHNRNNNILMTGLKF